MTSAETDDTVYAHPLPPPPLMPPTRPWYKDLPPASLPPRPINNHNTQICEVIRDLMRLWAFDAPLFAFCPLKAPMSPSSPPLPPSPPPSQVYWTQGVSWALHSSTSSATMMAISTKSRGWKEDQRRRFVYDHYV